MLQHVLHSEYEPTRFIVNYLATVLVSLKSFLQQTSQ